MVPAADARRLEERVRELERQLGRKTLEVELLRRPSTSRAQKSDLAVELAAAGRFAVKAITDTLGVPRSNVIERVRATHAKREPRTRDED